MSENARGELIKELRYCIGQYRIAVRWLRDARIYKSTYSQDLTYEGKSWKADEVDVCEDAAIAYKEAISGVLYWRNRVNNCNNKLINLAGEKNGRTKTSIK